MHLDQDDIIDRATSFDAIPKISAPARDILYPKCVPPSHSAALKVLIAGTEGR